MSHWMCYPPLIRQVGPYRVLADAVEVVSTRALVLQAMRVQCAIDFFSNGVIASPCANPTVAIGLRHPSVPYRGRAGVRLAQR